MPSKPIIAKTNKEKRENVNHTVSQPKIVFRHIFVELFDVVLHQSK